MKRISTSRSELGERSRTYGWTKEVALSNVLTVPAAVWEMETVTAFLPVFLTVMVWSGLRC